MDTSSKSLVLFFSAAVSLFLLAACTTSLNETFQQGKNVNVYAEDKQLDVSKSIYNQSNSLSQEVFYYIQVDRFVNGDTRNDRGGINGAHTSHGFKPGDYNFFQGGDLVGVASQLDHMSSLGVTALWLSPIQQVLPVQAGKSGFHGYWPVNFTRVDPHFGTADEFKSLVKAAHEKGLKVYMDIHLSHTADLIKYDDCHGQDVSFQVVESCNFTEDGYSAYVSRDAPIKKRPLWLNDIDVYENKGDRADTLVSLLEGDDRGLDKLDFDQSVIRNGMKSIYQYWMDTYDVDGFNVINADSIDADYLKEWIQYIYKHAQGKNKLSFQVLLNDRLNDGSISSFKRARDIRLPNLINQQFAAQIIQQLTHGDQNAWGEYWNTFDPYLSHELSLNNFIYSPYGQNKMRLHDVIQSKVGNKGQVAKQLPLIYAAMFLTPGVPTLLYGDEFALKGAKGDYPAMSRFQKDQTADLRSDIKEIINLYKKEAVFQSGHFALYNQADKRLLRFIRFNEHKRIHVLINFQAQAQWTSIPSASDALNVISTHRKQIKIAQRKQKSILKIPANSYVVVEEILNEGELDQVSTDEPELKLLDIQEGDQVTGWIDLHAQISNSLPSATPTVDFEISVNGGGYYSIGETSTLPFKLVFDSKSFSSHTQLWLRAKANIQGLLYTSDPVTVVVNHDLKPIVQLLLDKNEKLKEKLLYLLSENGEQYGPYSYDTKRGMFSFEMPEEAEGLSLVFLNKDYQSDFYSPIYLSQGFIEKYITHAKDKRNISTLIIDSAFRVMGQEASQVLEETSTAQHILGVVDETAKFFRGNVNNWEPVDEMRLVKPGVYQLSRYLSAGPISYKFADELWSDEHNMGAPLAEFGFNEGEQSENLYHYIEQAGFYDIYLYRGRQGEDEFAYSLFVPNKGKYGDEIDGTLRPSTSYELTDLTFNYVGNETYEAWLDISTRNQYFLRIGEGQTTFGRKQAIQVASPARLYRLDNSLESTQLKFEKTGQYLASLRAEQSQSKLKLVYKGPSISPEDLPPFDAPIFIRGNLGDFGWIFTRAENQFTYFGENTYRLKLKLKAGEYHFKVATKDWGNINLGNNTRQKLTLAHSVKLAQGQNPENVSIVVSNAGWYEFELSAIDPFAPKLTLKRVK